MRLPLLALIAAVLLVPSSANAAPVVGGTETDRTWPFMGYIESGRQELELGDGQFCGASLIAPTWVLTAAHCATIAPAIDPLVTTFVIGRHAKSENGGERIQVRRVIVHEGYGSPKDMSNDVMLLELQRAPADAQPVTIASASEAGLWAPGASATIIGWGLTEEGGDGSNVLMEAQVPIVSDSDCATAYPGDIDAATMVCAGFPQGGTDTCQGDSGGPMLVPAADGGWRQVGVTSWGDGCARAGKPGVYSRVAGDSLRAWIAAIVPDAIAKSGSGTPPAAAPAPAPSPAPQPTPGAGTNSQPGAQPAPRPAPSSSRSAAARRKAAAARKRCLKKARKIKSAKKRKRAVRACTRPKKR